MQIGLMCR